LIVQGTPFTTVLCCCFVVFDLFFSKCGHGLQVRFKVGRRPCRGEGRLMLPLRPYDIRTNKLAHSMSRVFGCISHSGTHGNSHVARTHSFVYLVTSYARKANHFPVKYYGLEKLSVVLLQIHEFIIFLRFFESNPLSHIKIRGP
jgi:hypothetical protein